MIRIFRYILKTDNGMAPCIDGELLSLATCKPKIRSSARPGDWVMGFYPKPKPRGVLAWAARVERCLSVGDYQLQFTTRSDAVYRLLEDGSYERLRPAYHDKNKSFRKDISAPVLVFDRAETWYFGGSPQQLPPGLTHLAASGQGHRVRGVADGDVATLTAWLRNCGPPGIYGRPRDRPSRKTPLRSC
jgi:hypothetical protein